MFRHLLIPTDGSPSAGKAIAGGVGLAKALGARVTGYCAVPPLRQEFYGEDISRDRTLARLKRNAMEKARQYVSAVERAAREADVPFEAVVETAETTYLGIIGTASKRRCDLIVMGSHGTSGIRRLLLGSVASQVLTYSKIPVLVYR